MSLFPTERSVRTTPEGLLWEPGVPVPCYAFPREEVRTDLLRPAKNPRTGAHTGSQAFYDLEVDGELVENAAWTFPADDLAGHIAFEWFRHWDSGLDHWYEEEEEIFVHPRDPHKRVDALPSSRHVVVEIAGTVVADTRRPVLLFETSLPTRYYIPREDVRLDLFTPTDHRTGCPYKGTAEYWSAEVADGRVEDIAWSYRTPLPESERIASLVCFYAERSDLFIDGEAQERPKTKFS